MFKQATLFVVGAGASAEFGLPVGSALKRKIADKLFFSWEGGYRLKSGSPKLVEALRKKVLRPDRSPGDLNPYADAGRKISSAMDQAFSIDNYIDAHREDKKIEFVGKMGIISEILEAEKLSSIYAPSDIWNFTNDRRSHIDFRSVEKTWIGVLQKMLFENVDKSNVHRIFENVTFFTFNYDRCIEHFLPYSISNYYDIPLMDAVQIVSKSRIYHAYGAVGRMPWQAGSGVQFTFGDTEYEERINEAVLGIKTFAEGIEGSEALDSIRQAVDLAQTVIFLGMGYHEQNMQILGKLNDSRVQPKQIFGTCVGISNSDQDFIKTRIEHYMGIAAHNLRSDLKCADLLREYWRSILA